MPLPTFKFRLNNQKMSFIEGAGLRFDAFSGNGEHANSPYSVAKPGAGPLPPGRYYIVDRESGGRLSRLRDAVTARYSGVDHNEWFALYCQDGAVDDFTFIHGVQRGNFRLHPAGPLNLSQGCLTLPSRNEFYRLRNLLKNSALYHTIPGTGTRYYGIVDVFPDEKLASAPPNARPFCR